MPPIEAVLEENQALKGRVATLSEKVAELELQLALFKKQIFGTGKNEKQDKTQLLLKLGQLETKLLEARTATITYERREPSAPRPPAEAVFAHLPVKERIEIIPPQVQADPTLYERIGEETTFEVDIIPPQLFKRLIVRPKYRHALDRSRPPLVAPAPKRPVEGGYASAELIAGPYLQADETPVRCQDPDAPVGKTSLGYLWAISRPGEDVVFDWRMSRS